MPAPSVVLTYQEYLALPADGRRYEVHEGELCVTPAPSPQHQRIARSLFELLHHHVSGQALGEVFFAPLDVILSETSVVQPDLVYLDRARLGAVSARGVEGPPTLVVEILSPSTVLLDRSAKPQLYARHGVPYYWLVDPEARAVEAFTLGPAGYSLAARAAGPDPVSLPPFPGLAFAPASLWP
jgi:Uma2 family endonuclease